MSLNVDSKGIRPKWNVENSLKCNKKLDSKEISVSGCSPGGA